MSQGQGWGRLVLNIGLSRGVVVGRGGGQGSAKIYSGHYSIKCDEAVSFLARTQDRQSAVKLCISGGNQKCIFTGPGHNAFHVEQQ
jgi:hypothetical protein